MRTTQIMLVFILIASVSAVGFLLEISLLLRQLVKILGRVDDRLERKAK